MISPVKQCPPHVQAMFTNAHRKSSPSQAMSTACPPHVQHCPPRVHALSTACPPHCAPHEAREQTKSNETWVIGASATEAPITNFHFTPHLCTPARVVLARGGGPCARESFSEFNRQSRDYQHSLFSVPIRACMTGARHIASLRRGWRTRQT